MGEIKWTGVMAGLGFVIAACILSLVLGGCGSITDDSTHKIEVGGDATITHRFEIDTSMCDELPKEEKIECIRTLLDVLEAQAETGELAGEVGDAGKNN